MTILAIFASHRYPLSGVTLPLRNLDGKYNPSYTPSMKTAVSLPDELFTEAESVARRSGVSRSELYAKAIRHYLESTHDDRITERLDEFYGAFVQEPDEFLVRAAAILLARADA